MRFFIALMLIQGLSFAQAKPSKRLPNQTEPSSAIPDRREFPIDASVNPCQDFHKYVCAEVEASFKLRDDRSRHTFAFSDSDERLLEKKKDFFKGIAKEKGLSTRGQQLKNFYTACMNEKEGVKEEQRAIAKYSREIDALKTTQDLMKYDQANMLEGRFSLMDFGNNPNVGNSDVYDLVLMLSLMGLPDHDYYNKPEVVSAYKDLLVSFFKTIEPNAPPAQIQERVERMYNLEKDFVAIYPRVEVRRQRWAEKRDISQEEMVKAYPQLKLDSLLGKVPKKTRVGIPIPEALAFYNQVIASGSVDTLKDIYLYKAASRLMDDAYPKYYQQKFEFSRKYFGGPEKRPDRQERCTEMVEGSFNRELDQILLERIFPNFPAAKVNEVVEKVRKSILEGLKQNTWLSAEAKAEAIKKISTAKLQVVAPTNDREWDFAPTRKYSPAKKIHNAETHGQAMVDKIIAEMQGPVNKDAWGMGPLTVNAYYSRAENKYVMPIGILQYPFFDRDGSVIENLGAVGVVVGHELGHGIDDQGSRFDENGVLRQWMTMNDLAQFSKRGQGMIAQFDKIGHNGKNTIGENIADLVGLTFAYQAAFPEGSKSSIEDKQKFFIAYARLWCGVRRPGMEERQLKTDPHAMGYARINQQMKHQKGFAEAFSCKPGDAMTLPDSERISIW